MQLLSERFAEFVLSKRFEEIPLAALEKARHCVIDCLGCMLAGSRESVSGIAVDYVRALGGNQDAGVIGHNLMTSVYNAALANGVIGHALDYDDMSANLIGHPTTVVLPAVLALGEQKKISGRQALEAYCLGTEIACALGRGANPRHYQNGWHPTVSIGVFGATAAAGKILGLSREMLINAFGIAASESSGLRENFGTMTKPLHAGLAAAKGVRSAMLALRNFTAAKNIFEGDAGFFKTMAGDYDLERVYESLGNPYELESPGLSIKPYPACGATFNAIDAMRALATENYVKPEDVERIECGSVPIAKDVLIYPRPQKGLEGKFSMPFCLAMALTEKNVLLDHFTDQKVSDPSVIDLMSKVDLYVDPELAAGYGYRGTFNAIVKIRFKDGRELVKRIDFGKGSPENPLTEDEVFDKYTDCARRVLPPGKVDASVQMLKEFSQMSNIADFMGVVCGEMK